MRLNKSIFSFLIFFFTLTTWVCAYSEAPKQNDPVALLQYIADNMITGLRENQATLKSKPGIVYDLAYKYVVPYADLAIMSKRVLPPRVWTSASNEQRAQFQKEFTTTVIRTYASALTSYRDQTIKFYPIRGDQSHANTIEVQSAITSQDSGAIHVSYRLVHVGNVWRLYDMSVEGISLIDSFRSQFSDILAQGNMNQLLARMSSHNVR